MTVDTTKQDEALAAEVAEIKKQTGAATVAITELSGIVKGLVERFEMKEKKEKEEEKDPTPADLKKAIDELTNSVGTKLDEFEAAVDKLADPGSKQDTDPDTLKKKSDSGYELSGIL